MGRRVCPVGHFEKPLAMYVLDLAVCGYIKVKEIVS